MPRRTWSGLQFIAVNLWCTRIVPAAGESVVPLATSNDCLVLRTIRAADIDRFEGLHNILRPGKRLSASRKWLYQRTGAKLVWALETTEADLVGFNMYYFREGEWNDRIVHEAFIGVTKAYQGCGLSNDMRAAAADHFTAAGLNGITTEIHRDNLPSLRSACRQGFRETGADPGGKIHLLRRL